MLVVSGAGYAPSMGLGGFMNSIKNRIEAVRRYLEESGESQNSLAKAAGISGSTLSNVLAEKYAGSYEEVLLKIEDAMNRREEKERVRFKAPEFVETSISKKIMRALNDAAGVSVPRITVLHGDSGIGKTKTLEEFKRINPTSILVKIRPDFVISSILREVAEQMGLSPSGANYEITNRIIKKLQATGRILIFDEAEYLSARSLDIIRRIHDEAETPVVLVGMPKLYHNLVALRNGFEQVANRMVSYNLDKPESEDLERIVRACIPGIEKDVCQAFVECSKGTIRTLILLMQDMVNYEHNTGKKLTAKAVKAYVATLH